MIARTLLLWAALAAWPSARQAPSALDTPEAAVVRARCVGCHQTDLIAAQRLTGAAWDREIAKMERWGAQLTAAERQQVLTYLTSRFGPDSPPSPPATSPGQAIYRAACQSCHDDDLAMQQRLSAAAWGRTVDKMVQWGAPVAGDQKDALVAYLVSQWGPRR